jgi:hypothetical protein
MMANEAEMGIVKNSLKLLLVFYHLTVCRVIRWVKKRKKDIVLYCASPTMEEHIYDYYLQIKDEKMYNVYLYYPTKPFKDHKSSSFYKKITKTDVEIVNRLKYYFYPWDLVVSADLGVPFFSKREVPLLYINHGLHIVSHDHGKTLYAYGVQSKNKQGQPKFSIMLEPNKRISKYMIDHEKSFEDIIKWSGSKFAEDIIKAAANYYNYRHQLGVSEDTTLVCIFGTWGESSLFHVLGEGIFDYAQLLKTKGYQFIFSIHPNEYEVYDLQIKPMGLLVEAQREKGFIIRSPSEDWLPYLIASDVIICDYSSMYEIALIAEKKLILCDFPEDKVWEQSIAIYAKKYLPLIRKAEEMGMVLDQVKNSVEKKIALDFKSELVNLNYKGIVKDITEKLLIGE